MDKVKAKISELELRQDKTPLVLTVGNFDGVHIGHQFLINECLNEAKKVNGELVVVTFEPHPVEIFSPDVNNFLIIPYEEKIRRLRDLGCKHVVVLKFDRDFSVLTAEDFLEKYIWEQGLNNNLNTIVLGHDFLFGAGRKGNFDYCKNYFSNKNVSVKQAEKYSDKNSSSSLIREHISNGNVEEACTLLGSPFFNTGVVVKGEGRGRQIGIPTANINPSSKYIYPKAGVYVSQVLIDGMNYNSVTNVGFRPTFGVNALNIETHLFDFDKDIYGEKIQVSFLKKLREELAFNSVNDLIDQIKNDISAAKGFFSLSK